MAQSNIFVILTPLEEISRKAFRAEANAGRYGVEPEIDLDETISLNSRESTPAPSEVDDSNASGCMDNQLHITLEPAPKDPSRGWQFGTSKHADIVLGKKGQMIARAISGKHFHIKIDANGWVFLVDHSRYGTAVHYDGELTAETRRNESWLLFRGNMGTQITEDIVIRVEKLQFKIEFPLSRTSRSHYVRSLKEFYEEHQEAVPLVQRLDLTSYSTTTTTTTQEPSQAKTSADAADSSNQAKAPSEQTEEMTKPKPLYWSARILGEGSVARVKLMIRLRDGAEVAAKELKIPVLMNQRDRDVAKSRFKEEFRLMSLANHANVVRVIDFHSLPTPSIIMPYYRHGSLYEYSGCMNEAQFVSVARQVLIGSDYLWKAHKIVHRDLKPANILLDLSNNLLKAVIADFGSASAIESAQADDELYSFCGTSLYIAPEVASRGEGYGHKVDVWSLGVIALSYTCELPNWTAEYSSGIGIQEWQKIIRERVEHYKEDALIRLLKRMLEIDPERRGTASECLVLGSQEGLFKKVDEGFIDSEEVTAVGLFRSGAAAPDATIRG